MQRSGSLLKVVISRPNNRILPLVGFINFKQHLKRVDLPEPLCPIKATASPLDMEKLMSFRTACCPLKDLHSALMSRSACGKADVWAFDVACTDALRLLGG
jgi:hypothetical protein